MYKSWKYYWMHIPGGEKCQCHKREVVKGDGLTSEMTELQFLQKLAMWNRCGQGHWQYWTDLYPTQ